MSLTTYDITRHGANRLAFLFHGWGAEQHHLAAYVPLVDPTEQFSAICPRAPHELEEGDGASWYTKTPAGPERASFLSALQALEELIRDRSTRAGIPLRHCLIGGFSQGGFLALALAGKLGAPTYAGVWAMCCAIPEIEGLDLSFSAHSGSPALIQVGERDTIINPAHGREAAVRLNKAGWVVREKSYDMAHSQTIEMMLDAREWIAHL